MARLKGMRRNVTLSANAAYTIGAQASATVTIADNDVPLVTLVASDAAAAEAGGDPGKFTVAVTVTCQRI